MREQLEIFSRSDIGAKKKTQKFEPVFIYTW